MGGVRSIIIKQDLQQISDMLLLNGTLTECPGLVHGKMGIAVFFFHYAKYTGSELFADYAMDLIGEMLNQIHVNSPADYERGIAGIGVGIDYLIRNDFLKVEDDICEDFDQRMVRAVLYDPWQDFSKYTGLTGYGRYWITRLHYQLPIGQARECLLRIIALIEENLPDISDNEKSDVYSFLHDLCHIKGFEMCKGLLEHLKKQTMNEIHENIYLALKLIPDLDMEKSPESTGLLTGYAGEGMLRLTAINPKDMSWIQLL
ncbi:MAG: hypothetical protein FWD60_08010 [Candidatus Azobacteroides sp.]|nr:hypothetical protein [Candidatus Azobacteroides sp.]